MKAKKIFMHLSKLDLRRPLICCAFSQYKEMFYPLISRREACWRKPARVNACPLLWAKRNYSCLKCCWFRLSKCNKTGDGWKVMMKTGIITQQGPRLSVIKTCRSCMDPVWTQQVVWGWRVLRAEGERTHTDDVERIHFAGEMKLPDQS